MSEPVSSPTTSEQSTRNPAMPLSIVTHGTRVTILEIRGGRKMRQRLLDLGLTPGADVLVFKNDAPSPLILSVKDDSRLAIGRGMAHKILVSDKSLS